ncbi:MAG: DUF4349 domain-containing protein [Spirochaetaceae bacterium]
MKRRHIPSAAATAAAALFLILLSSCAGLGSYGAERADGAPAQARRSTVAEATTAFEAPAELQEGEAADEARVGRGGGPEDGERAAALPGRPTAPERPAEERLRVYSAELELLVPRIEAAREEIIRAAEAAGGYVESSGGEYITIRVPAERFDGVVEEIEGVGRVSSRAVRTADVTEQYADLGRRLELAKRTRERFYTLLERTPDTEERVEILREIRRLTERIERLNAQIESLDRRIAYSRISVRLIARIQNGGPRRADIPFPWIAALDPLERTTGEPDRRPAVKLPADYAVFDTGRFVRAETADGTRVRIGAVEHEPRGDSLFWQDALIYHLGDFYTVVRRVEARRPGATGRSEETLRGALFASKGVQRFFYLVLAGARNGEIIVAEAFFPDADARDARLDEIRDALSEAEL